jgi:hypothetical protein
LAPDCDRVILVVDGWWRPVLVDCGVAKNQISLPNSDCRVAYVSRKDWGVVNLFVIEALNDSDLKMDRIVLVGLPSKSGGLQVEMLHPCYPLLLISGHVDVSIVRVFAVVKLDHTGVNPWVGGQIVGLIELKLDERASRFACAESEVIWVDCESLVTKEFDSCALREVVSILFDSYRHLLQTANDVDRDFLRESTILSI